MYTIQLCRLSGRYRRQASSHIWIAGRQLEQRRLSGRHGSKLSRRRSSVAPKLCRYLCRDKGALANCLTGSGQKKANEWVFS